MGDMKTVGVVGGGIIGLATTEALLEDFSDIRVTVYSRDFTPNTTGDISGGFIWPAYNGENDKPEDLEYWTNATTKHLMKIRKEDAIAATAISPISGYFLYKSGEPSMPSLVEKLFPAARLVDEDEISRITMTQNRYAYGVFLTATSCDCGTYLPYLMKKLREKGVKFVKQEINSLHEVAKMGHDVVVNCTGFDAKVLINDNSMRPIRGQVIVAQAPWIKHFFIEFDGDFYIIPKKDTAIVGGTHAQDDSLAVDQKTSKRIWDGACRLLPSLRSGTVLKEAAGIRPGRPQIRMEVEQARTLCGQPYIVLHHYGHGGSGVTLHWGCAKHASSVLQRFLYSINSNL